MKIPCWYECNEKATAMQELTPLETFVHSQEPIGKLGKDFKSELQAAVDWI